MSKELLNYIGFDLNTIPSELVAEKPKLTISDAKDEADVYRIYKYVAVKDIDIFISTTDRTTPISERYKKSLALDEYVKQNPEEFNDVMDKASLLDILNFEKMQKKLNTKMPFFIKYDDNYLWQIFYSTEDKKYYMLFPAKEGKTSVLFYLIKKKLTDPEFKVFIPICKMSYCEDLLTRKEINELENYIWSFTKNWCNVFEVYHDIENDKVYKNFIIGETALFTGFKTKYRVKIETRSEALNFYTLVKALFILATETHNAFPIETAVDKKGELIFKYKGKQITIQNISKFISKQYKDMLETRVSINSDIESIKLKISKLKEQIKTDNVNYVYYEKQIVMFLECKQSFFKKVRYFFKKNKAIPIEKIEQTIDVNNDVADEKNDSYRARDIKDDKERLKILDGISSKRAKTNKDVYTLSDLVGLCNDLREYEQIYSNLQADHRALLLKKTNLDKKIENAKNYIEEIEKHKKSIFEFWKFTNKDKIEELHEGSSFGIGNESTNKIDPGFNIEDDLEEFAQKVDELQRRKLSVNECDSLFATQYIIETINAILDEREKTENGELKKTKVAGRKNKSEKIIEKQLEELKNSYDENIKAEIFGNLMEDRTKVQVLNNKEYRENSRNIYAVLGINDLTTFEEYKNSCEDLINYLNEAFVKIKSVQDVPVYYPYSDGYVIGDLNPREILKDKEVFKIYRTITNNDMHILYFSNIIYFYNNNKTLPLGMDVSTRVLMKPQEFSEEKITEFNIILEDGPFNVEIREIELIEDASKE